MTLTKYSGAYQELFDGCVAYWDGSLTSDGKLQDIIGGYHGTLSKVAKTGINRFGVENSCLFFSQPGTNGSVINLSNNITSATDTAIMMWVKLESTPSVIHELCVLMYGNGIQFCKASSNKYEFRVINTSNTQYSAQSITESQLPAIWTCVCGIIRNNTINIYINGILEGTGTFTGTRSTRPWNAGYNAIGGWNTGGSVVYCAGGLFNEMFIWNGAGLCPTDEKIKALYELTKNKYLYPVQAGIRNVE